ncbi:DUF4294 domain-containing protein [Zhouia amylolytica]|nr:DUF4294 domain-containing protein [Zhouia amylolytica]
MKRVIFYMLMFSVFMVYAQVEKPIDTAKTLYFIDGDTIPVSEIALEPVYVFQPLRFKDRKERVQYYILKRKTIKVYPYAKLAAERLVSLNERLGQIESKRKRKKYTKMLQQYMEEEFTEELKKLTRTEGQILVKLIHRQTGITTFDLVKDLRSGWRAFWYNTTASMFDISLKEEYHPESNHEDYLIEDILQRAFAVNRIPRQPSVLDFDYATLTNKWTNRQ